jgi:hypothetical protein
MTFCFAFNARDRGGIGIISDRRISNSTTYGDVAVENDEATKVFQLTESCGLAVAGNLNLVSALMFRLGSRAQMFSSQDRLENTTRYLGNRYIELVTLNACYRDPAINASMIFFDCHRNRSSTKYRMARLLFDYDPVERRAMIGRTFRQKYDWFTIGASKEIRTKLGQSGAQALSDLASKNAQYYPAPPEMVNKIKAKHDFSPEAAFYLLDTSKGEPMYRATDRNRLQGLEMPVPGYTDFLAMAASATIQAEIVAMHRSFVPNSFSISQNLHVGVFEAGRGLRLVTANVMPPKP